MARTKKALSVTVTITITPEQKERLERYVKENFNPDLAVDWTNCVGGWAERGFKDQLAIVISQQDAKDAMQREPACPPST